MTQAKLFMGNLLSKTGDKKAEISGGNLFKYADLNESRMDILNDMEEKYGRNSDK